MKGHASHSIRYYFIANLLLQIFDGLLTYQVVSAGVPEANPLVRDTITALGLLWGLVYWKALACVLLFLIFTLRHRQRSLAFQAFALIGAVYGSAGFIALCAAFLELR